MLTKMLDIKLEEISIDMYIGQEIAIIAKLLPEECTEKNLVWNSSDESIATVENGKITAKNLGVCNITVKNEEEPIISKTIVVRIIAKPIYEKDIVHKLDGLTYIKGILIVNKKYSVPSTYNPGNVPIAYNALASLQDAAKKVGYKIPLLSGFRSYSRQETLYNDYVLKYGQTSTDTFSARPGHSEHQTGLAFDVGSITDSYGDTAAGKWLAENCHNYGFIIRYPKGKQSITGYKYEPWHIRYIGTSEAINVYNSGKCLEEYLGI